MGECRRSDQRRRRRQRRQRRNACTNQIEPRKRRAIQSAAANEGGVRAADTDTDANQKAKKRSFSGLLLPLPSGSPAPHPTTTTMPLRDGGCRWWRGAARRGPNDGRAGEQETTRRKRYRTKARGSMARDEDENVRHGARTHARAVKKYTINTAKSSRAVRRQFAFRDAAATP